MKGLLKLLGVILIVGLVVCGIYMYREGSFDSVLSKLGEKENQEVAQVPEEEKEIEEEIVKEVKPAEPEIKIFSGNARPVSFMIDNNKNAQPQASLNKAYMVYEIIVEGGESRLMAIFKGVTADVVGPIRSARHYFLDYGMENDVIYAHLGMSPQAEAGFEQFGIDHVNGQIYDTGKARTSTSLYWRAKHKKAPHNAYTNTESILKIAQDKGWRTTSDKESVLNYVAEEVILDSEDAINVASVKIPYAKGHTVEYKYDAETQRYTRYSKGKKMSDETTGEDVTTKNIIITFAENYTLNDGENKGRQDVITVGALDGYYITNGKAIKIKCVKESREDQTVYTNLNGEEIKVNDGNTWVNVCPIDANVTFSE